MTCHVGTHVTRTKTESCSYMTRLRRSDVYMEEGVCEVFRFDNLVVDDILSMYI